MGGRTRKRFGSGIAVLGALAAILVPALALADKQITSTPPCCRFTPADYTMDQGERLTFSNNDTVGHDVTSKDRLPDNRRLFSTPTIEGGRSAFVEGSQYLTTGTYRFECTIHPGMEGTLRVTSNGTPQQRPGTGGGGTGGGGGADTERPRLVLGVRSTRVSQVRRSGRLRVALTANEAVRVAVTVRIGSRSAGAGSFPVAGGTRATVRSLRLSAAGRRALRGKRRATVSLSGRAVDTAGNVGTDTARGRLR